MDPQMWNALIQVMGSVGAQLSEANDNPIGAAMGKMASQSGQMGSYVNAKDKAMKQQQEWLSQLLGGGGSFKMDGKGMKIDMPMSPAGNPNPGGTSSMYQAAAGQGATLPTVPATPAPGAAPGGGGGMDMNALISGLMRPFLLGQRA